MSRLREYRWSVLCNGGQMNVARVCVRRWSSRAFSFQLGNNLGDYCNGHEKARLKDAELKSIKLTFFQPYSVFY